MIYLKFAVTVRAAVMVTTQVPVPEHPPPDQRRKEPDEATAVRVTVVL